MGATTDATPDDVLDDRHGEQISEKVVTAVAEAKGVDPLDLDPIYDVVDPDALNGLFQRSGGSSPDGMELRMSIAGCDVVVQGEGEVTVFPPTTDDGPTSDSIDE